MNYNELKSLCCQFYDSEILPRVLQDQDEKYDCAESLDLLLSKLGITFQEFRSCILMYSLGLGLDYIGEAFEMYQSIPHGFLSEESENDFVGNCTQEPPSKNERLGQIPEQPPEVLQ